MDYLPHFRREAQAFEDAIRQAADIGGAPTVPSCPDWSVADLTLHLGGIHRYVGLIVRERLQEPRTPPTSPSSGFPRTRRAGRCRGRPDGSR
ncbi:maleylpyruvate isomerase N-terminal domain-containing protein [Streptomyces stramineus]